MLRTASSLPLAGLLTLGSGPARFQTGPPACYRASWQLPGPDFHRQATTSLRTQGNTMALRHGAPPVLLGARENLNECGKKILALTAVARLSDPVPARRTAPDGTAASAEAGVHPVLLRSRLTGRANPICGSRWTRVTCLAAGPGEPGCYPGLAGGLRLWLWLWRTLVLSLFHAVVVPSGFRTSVQPHR